VAGVAAGFEVLRQAEQELLDLLRGVEPPQHGKLGLGQAEVLAPGKFPLRGHGRAEYTVAISRRLTARAVLLDT
jgi:hypothetical protein